MSPSLALLWSMALAHVPRAASGARRSRREMAMVRRVRLRMVAVVPLSQTCYKLQVSMDLSRDPLPGQASSCMPGHRET